MSLAETSPRVIELPNEPVRVEGFASREDERKFLTEVSSIGLSTRRVKTWKNIDLGSYSDNKNAWQTLGHFDSDLGEFAVYQKNIEKFGSIARFGVEVHELAHANSPFVEENADLYGGKENRGRAGKHVVDVARQSVQSGVFLNQYHRHVFENWVNGSYVDQDGNNLGLWMFLEETHAIMTELRFTNSGQLKQINAKQAKRLGAENVVDIHTGITETVLVLLQNNGHANIVDSDSLDRHIKTIKETYFSTAASRLLYLPSETIKKAA